MPAVSDRGAGECRGAAMFRHPPFCCESRFALLLSACVASAGVVCAQLPVGGAIRGTDQYYFESFTVDSGLPGVAVNATCQTRDGFLWVATGGGLARFDGVHLVDFRPTDNPALRTPLIYRLLETRDGTLWIGTARGLVRRADGRFVNEGLDSAEVHALAEDRAGRLWVGTFGQGLFVREQGQLRPIDAAAMGGAKSVLSLLSDDTGRVWIAADNAGVFLSDGTSFHRFAGAAGITGVVQTMTEQPAGTFWFGTHADGLFRWRGGALTHFGRADGLAGEGVNDLERAADGGVWVVGARVQHIADPAHPAFTTIPTVPRGQIYALTEDREGSIWLSARERGLLRGGPLPYRLLSARDGLPNDIRSLAQDAAGNLWLAPQGGPPARLGVDRALMTLPASVPTATAVLAARDGTVWLGSAGELHTWRDGVVRSWPALRGVYGLFEDSRSAIWIGTVADGIFRYAAGQLHPVPLTTGGPLQHATYFCEGPDHAVYAATWSAGFARISGDRATRYTHQSGLPTDEVRSVYVDAENHVWLGFRGRGLGLWRDDRCWDPPALAQALFDHVSSITEDDSGELWLGTPAGVMWVSRADLLAAAAGAKPLSEVRIGQVNRSLRSASVWSGPQSVVCRTQDHVLLFATRDGVLALDPRKVRGRAVPPPVFIEQVTVDGRRSPAGKTLTLAAGAKNLLIDFTAPSFADPGQVLFRYRLDGYDAEWSDAKPARSAAYGTLAPGQYVFHVIACDPDGDWNRRGATLAIVQRPFFHQTPWFFGVIALGLGAAGVGLYRWSHYRLNLRLERLEARQATERERRRIAKNLHDDLGANLTEISLSSESIQQQIEAPALRAEMNALSERVRALAGTLDAIVWSANPANDSLDRLATFVCGLFQDLCRVTGTRCRIDMPENLPAVSLTPDQRSNLFLAAREAMTNMAKHSGASEAWLRLRVAAGWFELSLEDDGRGFDVDAAAAGNRNGIGNIRSRIAELRGTVTFDTAPGRGTRIHINVPLAGSLPAS